jgi:DNA-binding transcriptional regulator YhcF (GntR family)
MKKFEMLKIIYDSCSLTSKEVLVAQYFIYRSDKKGSCYPSVNTIAKECSVSERTVQRATGKLREKGFLNIEKRTVKGRQTSNEYQITACILEDSSEAENNPAHCKEEAVIEKSSTMVIKSLAEILYGTESQSTLSGINMEYVVMNYEDMVSVPFLETQEDHVIILAGDASNMLERETDDDTLPADLKVKPHNGYDKMGYQIDKWRRLSVRANSVSILLITLKWVHYRAYVYENTRYSMFSIAEVRTSVKIKPCFSYCIVIYRRVGLFTPFLGVSP